MKKGRPFGENNKISKTFRLKPELAKWLSDQKNATKIIEKAISEIIENNGEPKKEIMEIELKITKQQWVRLLVGTRRLISELEKEEETHETNELINKDRELERKIMKARFPNN